jgi:hypothetical protein
MFSSHDAGMLLQGFKLERTVLVDNDDYKAADGEHENMLHVPHWEQTEGEAARARGCSALHRLLGATQKVGQ